MLYLNLAKAFVEMTSGFLKAIFKKLEANKMLLVEFLSKINEPRLSRESEQSSFEKRFKTFTQ